MDKYAMFKNFMHNELGITKEDIREWVRESVQEEVRKVVNNTFDSFSVEDECRKEIRRQLTGSFSEVREKVFRAAVGELLKGVKITIKEAE